MKVILISGRTHVECKKALDGDRIFQIGERFAIFFSSLCMNLVDHGLPIEIELYGSPFHEAKIFVERDWRSWLNFDWKNPRSWRRTLCHRNEICLKEYVETEDDLAAAIKILEVAREFFKNNRFSRDQKKCSEILADLEKMRHDRLVEARHKDEKKQLFS